MQIVEQSSQELVLQQRRGWMAGALILFVLLIVFTLANLVVQGIARLGEFNRWELLSWLVWIGLSSTLAGLGILGVNNALRGMRCRFDRATATVTIERPRGLRLAVQQLSIYAVSRLEIEENQEMRLLAVYLVLRSGERLALASAPHFDADELRGIQMAVRDFLRSSA